MVKTYYDYAWFLRDCKKLLTDLPTDYDAVLAVARGGMSLGHMLSQALDIRHVHSVTLASYDKTAQRDSVTIDTLPDLSSYKKVLITEDIVDSGKSMEALMPLLQKSFPDTVFESVALFYKETASVRPDYFVNLATEWIDFFWEVDTL